MALIDLYSKEELKTIVENSYSIAEIIRKLGYSTNAGNNNQTIKSRIKEYEIDTSHFRHQNCTSVSVPRPSGRECKWAKAGAIAGNGWSLAWRLFDASGWGVPQRRKRLALVMDLRGQCAGKVLFEQTGVSGDLDKSVKTWKTIARPSEGCTAGDDSLVGDERSYTLKIRSGCAGGVKEHSCRMN